MSEGNTEDRTVTMTLSEYKNRIQNQVKLMALERFGVKFWVGYDDAIGMYERVIVDVLERVEREEGFKFDE